jgi:hypothetical protein
MPGWSFLRAGNWAVQPREAGADATAWLDLLYEIGVGILDIGRVHRLPA